MFGQTPWNSFEDIFNFQRDADKLFSQLWSEMPARSNRPAVTYPFQVHTSPDNWQIEIPMPGVDPKQVSIDVAGTTITVRVEQNGGRYDGETRFDQSMTVPQFLDLDRIVATHRHGMLMLTLPLKDSVKPRRVEIEGITASQKQLATS